MAYKFLAQYHMKNSNLEMASDYARKCCEFDEVGQRKLKRGIGYSSQFSVIYGRAVVIPVGFLLLLSLQSNFVPCVLTFSCGLNH